MNDAPMIAELGVLLAVMTDGTLSADQRVRLVTLLRDHPQARHFYKRYIELHVMLEWESGVAIEAPDDSTVLLELLQAERDAETFVLPQPARMTQPVAVSSSGQMTWREVGSAAAYLCGRPQAWGALAALLALAVVLVIVLLPSTEPSPVANNPIQDVTPPIAAAPVVATLTASQDAQWAGDAIALGSSLQANQRLTLTAGFAEITTTRGAIAILEAPATIELLDNNNALRLHAGKLVGICETPSSKGFLVRTPHMDVIDLGTRFGVAVDAVSGQVFTEVFQGLIEVRGHAGLDKPQRLSGGDRVAFDINGRETPPVSFARDIFANLNPTESSIIALSGDVIRSENLFTSKDKKSWPTGKKAFVMEELRGHTLLKEIPLTIAEPGTDQQFKPNTASVPIHTPIRSFVLINHPGTDADEFNQVVRGSVMFENEILGVLATGQDNVAFFRAIDTADGLATGLVAFDRFMGLESLSRQSPADIADLIEISADRRTLTFKLLTSRSGADALRVIVREPIEQSN